MKTSSIFRPLPYKDVDLRIARLIRKVLLFIPIPVIGISLMLYYLGDPVKAFVVLALVPWMLFLDILLTRGFLRPTVVVLVISINLLVTWSCTVANGVHDLGTIIYPITILFGSIVLKPRDIWFIGVFTGLCIVYLVIGERFDFYLPYPPYEGRIADVILLTLFLSTGFALISRLTYQLQNSVEHVGNEIAIQERIEEDIENSIASKHQLYREVHHRVKNHLAFINSVIDLEVMSNPAMDKRHAKELQNRIVAVARVHDQLYKTDEYELVATKSYLETIISNFMMTYQLTDSSLSLQLEDYEMEVDKIIYLGLFLHEIILFIAEHQTGNENLHLEVILSRGKETHLTIICGKGLDIREDPNSDHMRLLNFLTEKLKGSFDFVGGAYKSLFEIKF